MDKKFRILASLLTPILATPVIALRLVILKKNKIKIMKKIKKMN
nr:hypothetical protein [Mycoplasmopsis bovis]